MHRTVRRSPHAAEAGLDTHEDHRGKGYALEVTSAWTKATRQQDWLPIYSTSWDKRVAEKFNVIHYASDFQLQ